MEQVPAYLSLFFIAITLPALWIFYRMSKNSGFLLGLGAVWLLLQALIAASGFYANSSGMPPRFSFAIIPPLALIAILFLVPAGRRWIDSLNLGQLTLLHTIRIPVEIGLFGLFAHKAIPGLMTFEGINFDIISGLGAPVIYYLAFVRQIIGRATLLTWNFICLGLLINIVGHAILSAPFDFQQIAFEQPNRAIFYFPFVWLPAFIVPLVLFAQLAAIRQLILTKSFSPWDTSMAS